MKTADIVVGETYAIGSREYPKKGRVLSIEKGTTKRVYGGRSVVGYQSKGTWIRVAIDSRGWGGSASETEDLVKPQNILMLWSEHEANRQAEKSTKEVADKRQQEAHDALVSALEGIVGHTRITKVWAWKGSDEVSVRLTPEQAHKLAERLHAAPQYSSD